MIEGLKPHSAYKDSGVPWLGQVPEHWEILRSKRLFAARKEFAAPEDVQLSATQAYGVIPQSEFERRVGRRVVRISMHLEKRRHVEKDDFVISMRSFQGGLERAWAEGAIRSSYVVLKAQRGVDVGFFAHLFKSHCYIRALQSTADFIRDGQDLNFSNFSSVDLPLPPIDEQAAMGRFLDHANRRIDRFIRAKRKLIALLNEQKQAIIHRAVTRGLDPNVAMKDSGVSGLGRIPEHWKVLRARFLFRVVTRRDVRADDRKLSVTQRRGIVPTSDMTENSTQARSFDRFQVCHVDDLVLNKYKAHLGVFWNAPQRGLITPNYTVFRPIGNTITRYFELLFHTGVYKDIFKSTVYGVTEGMSPLYTQDFYSTPTLCPPAEEQASIVEQVALLTPREDASIQKAEREIALIREYRTRLVADVVTGQLDVREVAARLPANEPEAASEELASVADQEEDSEPEEMAE